MAKVLMRASGGSAQYSAADVPALQALAVVEVDLLSGDTAALAACALVTEQLASAECVLSVSTALTRNQLLQNLYAFVEQAQRITWPPA